MLVATLPAQRYQQRFSSLTEGIRNDQKTLHWGRDKLTSGGEVAATGSKDIKYYSTTTAAISIEKGGLRTKFEQITTSVTVEKGQL